MADDADIADRQIEAALKEAHWRAQQQTRQAPALRPRGACHYCDEPVAAKLLFCDKACQEDHEIEEEQLKRMGRRQ